MWEVDYDTKTAQYIGQRVTLDDLRANNREYLYEEYSCSIEDWLDVHGWKVIEGANESEETPRKFTARRDSQ